MDLQLSDEQQLLTEAVDELLLQAREDELWPSLVEFGALDTGAVGAVELTLVARGLGATLAAVPYVDSAAAHYALRESLPAGASLAACLSEPGRSLGSQPTATFADGRLSGEKNAVSFAQSVDLLVVAVGDALALVPRGAPGLEFEDEHTLDPSLRPALVRLDAVAPTTMLGDVTHVENLAAVGGILACAESVGAASAVLDLAREYAAQRRQFGHTIASFQALRHLLADMHVKVESSWSSVIYAAASLDEDEKDALQTASIAKAYAARATRDVAHGALQVFGGIAFTAEHPAHRYLRRIIVRGGQFGTAAEHERSLGRSLPMGVEVTA
jgi:alkylation response protein AidB-like acyl-CoA dehydrogenase